MGNPWHGRLATERNLERSDFVFDPNVETLESAVHEPRLHSQVCDSWRHVLWCGRMRGSGKMIPRCRLSSAPIKGHPPCNGFRLHLHSFTSPGRGRRFTLWLALSPFTLSLLAPSVCFAGSRCHTPRCTRRHLTKERRLRGKGGDWRWKREITTTFCTRWPALRSARPMIPHVC